MTTIKILRVNSIHSREPVVLAIVDGYLVRWNVRHGWTCECDTEGDECAHVDLVVDLLDDRVIGEDQ